MVTQFDSSFADYGSYEVSSIGDEHIAQLAHLADLSVGEGYFNQDYFYDYLINTNKAAWIYSFENQLVGFSLMEHITVPDFISALEGHQSEIKNALTGINQLIVRRATSVHPSHRGKGIASDMVKRSIKQPPFQADAMISIAWKSNKGIHIQTPLLSNGFEPILEMKQFYATLSLKRQFICPQCGKPPCLCNAVLFKKSLG